MRRPSLLLCSLLFFSASALAQSDTASNTRQTTAATKTQNTKDSTTKTQNTKDSTTTSLPQITSTAAATTASAVVITASNSQNGDDAGLTGLPKLSSLYSIPTITPPPTRGAPFMQQSKYPEGTIFIAVGSGLAFLALIVFIWRGIVAWSLHRSMQRATAKPGIIDSKSPLHNVGKGGSGGTFYAVGPGSTLSLDHLGSSNRSQGPGPNGSLFFSPTSNPVAPPSAGGDRRSTYLPAGFYAAGNRNSGVIPNNSQTRFGRARGQGISPPGTPLMAPQSRGNASSIGTERLSSMRINDSQTSLALPPTGRAPSAYLEDLFENHQLSDHAPHSQGGRF